VPRVNRLKALIQAKQAKYREETGRNLPQHIIAVELGLDPSSLSEYINNKFASVSWDVWQRMVNYFGVSGDEIFNVTPDEEA
jgi:plasmid maintenance system antidote protein VapI